MKNWREYELEKDKRSLVGYAVISVCLTVLISVLVGLAFIQSVHAGTKQIDTTKAVIHHTDSHDVSAAEIDRWHKEFGWDGIGYHFVIRAGGQIERGRSLDKTGAHAKGRNDRIGIALTGRDTFTVAQTESLAKLLRDLGVKEIERHHEECPGPGLLLPGLTWNREHTEKVWVQADNSQ